MLKDLLGHLRALVLDLEVDHDFLNGRDVDGFVHAHHGFRDLRGRRPVSACPS